MEQTLLLYAVRDKNTGKLVSNITNPRRKFWEKKKCCEQAIRNYNQRNRRYGLRYDLELVELTFVEKGGTQSEDYTIS